MLNIINVAPGSIADELGIRPEDKLVKVNDRSIGDEIDFRFFSAEEKVDLLIQRGTKQFHYEIEKEYHEDIGIDLDAMKMKACGNNCVFCFVHQNPRGMRRAMYFKDEDYRFSFLYGHYVTLTTLKQKELERIVEQKLSPLYISVHATEEKTRKLLLGIKREDHLLQKIEFLVKGGVELHAQIVLCPGINDGEVFDQTVNDLKKFYPGVKSIAIVPVGLTRHRETLFPLRLHSKSELSEMITYTDKVRNSLKSEIGNAYIYLSDEFFIKAEKDLPEVDYYDDFYQIENGVGEFRQMIDQLESDLHNLPDKLDKPFKITWVTGLLAADILDKFILKKLRLIENLKISLRPVKNDFYGPNIQVSGLLVGEDIYNQINDNDLGDCVFLPPRVLNHDNLLLDDWSIDQLQNALGVQVHVYKESLAEIGEVIMNLRISK